MLDASLSHITVCFYGVIPFLMCLIFLVTTSRICLCRPIFREICDNDIVIVMPFLIEFALSALHYYGRPM